ncbi:MAG: T9SS type A sorting domain-containing protein, partial [Chitinophagales bacterium]
GNFIWAKRAVSEGFDVEKVKVSATLSGGVAVFGEATGRLSFEDGTTIQGKMDDSELFLVHYDADGNLMWVNQLGNTPENVRMGGIDVNDAGNLLVNGSFEGSMVLQNTTLQSAGKSDVFVAQFASNGSLQWARSEGSVLGEYAAAITAVKNTNQVAYTGRFYGSPMIEGQQLEAKSDKGNNYVVGFGGRSTKQSQIDISNTTSLKRIYPNPFQNNFIIELSAAKEETTIVHLYDIQGKLILENSYDLVKGYNSIEVRPNTLSNGLYLLEVIYGNNQSMTTKLNRVGK